MQSSSTPTFLLTSGLPFVSSRDTRTPRSVLETMVASYLIEDGKILAQTIASSIWSPAIPTGW